MARILDTGSLKRDNLLEMSTEAPKINDLGTTMKLGVYGEKDIMTQVKVLLGLQVSCAISCVTI